MLKIDSAINRDWFWWTLLDGRGMRRNSIGVCNVQANTLESRARRASPAYWHVKSRQISIIPANRPTWSSEPATNGILCVARILPKTSRAMTKKPKTTSTDSAANLGFEAKLWQMADGLRNNMDAAGYKHVVLGLIFLKYIPVILVFGQLIDEAAAGLPVARVRQV